MIKILLLNIDVEQVMMVNYMYDINLLNYHHDHEHIVEVLNMIDMDPVMFQWFENVFRYLNLFFHVLMEQFYLIVYVHSRK